MTIGDAIEERVAAPPLTRLAPIVDARGPRYWLIAAGGTSCRQHCVHTRPHPREAVRLPYRRICNKRKIKHHIATSLYFSLCSEIWIAIGARLGVEVTTRTHSIFPFPNRYGTARVRAHNQHFTRRDLPTLPVAPFQRYSLSEARLLHRANVSRCLMRRRRRGARVGVTHRHPRNRPCSAACSVWARPSRK